MNEKKNEIAVVIPAYNEEKTIGNVLLEAKKYVSLIVVVDDGSDDQTAEIAEKLNVKVLHHAANLGKGAALKTGCQAAVNLGAKIIITMDADGQHKPEDIPRFINVLQNKKVDLVLGSRNLGFGMPLVRILGSKIVSFFIAKLFNIYITDPLCGFRAFTRKSYQKLIWDSSDYAVETEMIARAGINKINFVEIPIETVYIDKYKGMSILDAYRVIATIFKWRFLK